MHYLAILICRELVNSIYRFHVDRAHSSVYLFSFVGANVVLHTGSIQTRATGVNLADTQGNIHVIALS